MTFIDWKNSNKFLSIKQCTDKLPEDSKRYLSSPSAPFSISLGPRYSMGIGFAEG